MLESKDIEPLLKNSTTCALFSHGIEEL